MGRKSTDYSNPDAGGWMNACDDLFLARFRGRPCELCGSPAYMGTRSCGHHLVEKGMHRAYRYDERLILVLCPEHHSRFARDMSPHSDDTTAQARFIEWLRLNRPEKHALLLSITSQPFDHSWKYRDMYTTLGGEIVSKTGLQKDMRPKGHSAKVRFYENQPKENIND